MRAAHRVDGPVGRDGGSYVDPRPLRPTRAGRHYRLRSWRPWELREAEGRLASGWRPCHERRVRDARRDVRGHLHEPRARDVVRLVDAVRVGGVELQDVVVDVAGGVGREGTRDKRVGRIQITGEDGRDLLHDTTGLPVELPDGAVGAGCVDEVSDEDCVEDRFPAVEAPALGR